MTSASEKFSDEDLTRLLNNLGDWGAYAVTNLKRDWGSKAFLRLRRNGYADLLETNWGKVAILNRKGRQSIGFTNEYYPSMNSIGSALALREAVEILQKEGFTSVKPKHYGRAHPQMTAPNGDLVCVVARIQGLRVRALARLAERLAEESYAGLNRIVLFGARALSSPSQPTAVPVEYRQFPKGSLVNQSTKALARGKDETEDEEDD